MGKVYYKLSEGITVEEYKEGALISLEDSDQIVCLGLYEYELLEIVLEHDKDEVLSILSEKYQGTDMQADLEEFCDKLCECSVLCKYEL